jgi:DNA polymerase
LHEKLSSRFIESQVLDIFQEAKKDLIKRKISLNLNNLHTVTRNCRKCEISSTAELPKWNIENPDIVVVIDSPNLNQEAISIMIDAFTKAGIQSQQLCLTYVNRCPVKRKYEQEEIFNCSPYLHTEIQILNPKLIMTLGAVPTSCMFGNSIKITDLRGSIRWIGYWPILPTYSPSYIAYTSQIETNLSAKDNFYKDILQAKKFITKAQNDN